MGTGVDVFVIVEVGQEDKVKVVTAWLRVTILERVVEVVPVVLDINEFELKYIALDVFVIAIAELNTVDENILAVTVLFEVAVTVLFEVDELVGVGAIATDIVELLAKKEKIYNVEIHSKIINKCPVVFHKQKQKKCLSGC